MAKFGSALVLSGALALSACGELSPAEQAKIDAMMACSDRTSAAFPVFKTMPNVDEEQSADEFQVDLMGAFSWSWSVRGKNRPLPNRFSCRGNVSQRTIKSVEFDGVVKRPSAQEVWKF